MRHRSVFYRWISRSVAEMYVARFGGKIVRDINGYTVLYDMWRSPLAFVREGA